MGNSLCGVMLQSTAEGVCIARVSDDKILHVNPRCESLLGYGPGELMGRRAAALGAPPASEEEEEGVLRAEEALRRHGEAQYERRMRRKNGTTLWVRTRTSLFDHERWGKVWVSVHSDVTEQVRAREERARCEAERVRLARAIEAERVWLRSLVDAAPVAIVAVDRHGELSCSRQAVELFGADPRQGSPTCIGLLLDEDGGALAPEELPTARALAGATVEGRALRVRRPDGSERRVLADARPVRAGDGRCIGAIATFEDVTAIKRAEEEERLLATAGRLLVESLDPAATFDSVARVAVPAIGDGCVLHVVDPDGSLALAAIHCPDEDVRRAVEELMCRYPSSGAARATAAVARDRASCFIPVVDESVWRSLAQDDDHFALLRATRTTGYLIVPLVARDRVVGTLTLFTCRPGRRLEERALTLVERLGNIAALTIDNAQLYDGERNAIRQREEVLGVVAHDLRNPLSAVRLCATLVAARANGRADLVGPAQSIDRAVERMNRLIEDLLDVARLRHGRLPISPDEQDVVSIVEEALEGAQSNRARRTLLAATAPHLPTVSADRGRILQVLANLIDNAVKFTPPDGVIIIGAMQIDDRVELSVSDTGDGIAPESVARVFDDFWQGRRTDRRGAGLGLGICRGIVEAHGGTIRLDSRLGEGTTVRFTLPVARPAATRAPQPLERLPGVTPITSALAKPRKPPSVRRPPRRPRRIPPQPQVRSP